MKIYTEFVKNEYGIMNEFYTVEYPDGLKYQYLDMVNAENHFRRAFSAEYGITNNLAR